MTADLIKYAFIAGEISPSLFGRTDLTKYDLAVAEARNFFVDYRGGLSSRPGTQYIAQVKEDQRDTRMFTFSFAPDLSNNYILFFGHNYVRFIQDGGYVLLSVPITAITNAFPGVVTAAGHGMHNGQQFTLTGVVGMTQVNNLVLYARNVTANTFELGISPGLGLDTTSYGVYTSGGTAGGLYEVPLPFPAEDLSLLTFEQYRDLVRITSTKYPTYNLIRYDHTDWRLELEVLSPYYVGPTILSTTASETGSAQVVFAVTKVLPDGTESVIGPPFRVDGVVNYPATEGSVSIVWGADNTAEYYNVYRSIVSVGEVLLPGTELGYVGRAFGTKFTDPNIVPDFTRVPPLNYNPFAPGAVEKITVTAPGAGYPPFATTISVDGGSGFAADVVVDDAGGVVNVIIKSGGQGYPQNPVVTFGGGGAGATATAEVRELIGTYPALSGIFQQRQIYAGTNNDPITIWGSRIKQFSNFASSPLVLDDDAFEFQLDTKAVAAIKHLLVTRGGLLAMTQVDVWLMNGGSSNSPITPTNALADPQSYSGVGDVRPIGIGNDLLFTEGKGHAVRMLTYNEISKVYASDDRSILSSHLFGPGKDITHWAYQESPHKVVWAVREDGLLLAFTVVKSEEVFAWTPCDTQGKVVDLVSIRENNEDRIYIVVKRYNGTAYGKFIERMDLRQYVNAEDAWCVDCGLSLTPFYPDGTIIISHNTTTDVWSAVSTYGPSIGQFIRGGDGIFKVTQVTGGIILEMYAEPTNFVPETTSTYPMGRGEWTLDTPTTVLNGLGHLEGQTVSILGDGNVFPPQKVAAGRVTLPAPVTRAIVGLKYTCRAKTLPINVPNQSIEAKRKRIVGIGVRLDKSRGIKIGPTLDRMYEMRERSTEPYGHPIKIISGMQYQLQQPDWNEENQTYFVQDNPLPVNILSVVFDVEVGDEPD